MSDPEVERIAGFLGAHALVLLGLGLAAACLSVIAIASAVRFIARHRGLLAAGLLWVAERAERLRGVGPFVARSRGLLPTAYVGVHLILGLLLVAAVTIFAGLAEDVIAGEELAAFDVAFARALRDGARDEWVRFFAAVSWCGSRDVLAAGTAGIAVLLLVRREAALAAAWIAAQGGGGLLNLALKATFERTRPEFADPLLAAAGWSFPSGHAMGTFIFFGLGCYLILRERRSPTAAITTIAIAVGWCLLMAFSRLYLGVHYVSDVLAGLVAGIAWVAVCASGIELIRRRRASPE